MTQLDTALQELSQCLAEAETLFKLVKPASGLKDVLPLRSKLVTKVGEVWPQGPRTKVAAPRTLENHDLHVKKEFPRLSKYRGFDRERCRRTEPAIPISLPIEREILARGVCA